MKSVYIMKQCLIFIFILINVSAIGQAPAAISWQAVVRNSSGSPLANQAIRLRFSIRDSVAAGAIQYRETWPVTTNSQGLANVSVGLGTVVSGTMNGVNWGRNAKFMQVEMDTTGGTTFVDMGTTQMMSVPYALFAGSASGSRPVVLTRTTSGLSYTSVSIGGNVTSTGNEAIIMRGVCVDTSKSPTISSIKNITAGDTGVYTVQLAGLTPNTRYYARAFASNRNGDGYGDTISFITPALTAPTVTSDTISNLTNVAFTCGGNVSADGGSAVTARGICYATTATPTTSNSILAGGTGTGTFSGTVAGLTSGIVYYTCAYATNAIGTAYGAIRTLTTVVLSVPTLTTDTPTSISYTTATAGLNVSDAGGVTITAQGVCYSTSTTPTTANSRVTTANGVGHYTASITGLTANTIYYVRGYATNSRGTAYGAQYTFTTQALTTPTVTTNSVIGISTTSATSGGNVTIGGGTTVTQRGVCWGVSATPTKDSAHTTDGTGTGAYNSNMTGLTPSTTYNVRAYAINTTGVAYGSLTGFTTTSVVPTGAAVPVVATTVPTSSSATQTSGGYVTISAGSAVTARGVCWATHSSPTLADSFTVDGSGLGTFTSIFNFFGCAATYYTRAYATNSTGTGYGNEYSKVAGAVPLLADSSIRSITVNSAVYGGNIVTDNGCTITQKGICWAVSPNPTTTDFKIISGATTAAFTATMTGLYPNLTYHVRTFATNVNGTGYGADQSFTTSTTSAPVVGNFYGGGYVFYVDTSGSHGLIIAPTDQPAVPFGCQGTLLGDTAKIIGSGQANTALILANCHSTATSAYVCDTLNLNGYSDWFLPSYGEIAEAGRVFGPVGIANMNNRQFHCSTELNATAQWQLVVGPLPSSGTFSGGNARTDVRNTRAIRRF